ncbi:MAG: ribosome small subunit-dependent GTPase A [Bacteroidetes bacterium]|nr:ribosome small subunit-dependent GTPase A [Bacteroidota bacterium]MBU1114764.1 ribosome small subunit-dependent GTPase A [Bacteroidota bacterium]MBU1797787.1 ribosome small subunit-dependent GTPase A [Bacteroidota bacterium]
MDENGKSIICRLPGRFKNKFHLKQNKQRVLDIVTIGDRVKISINKDGRGEILKIMDRENFFSRKAPFLKGTAGKGERLEQIFAANIDNVVIVASANNPVFNNRLIDRITVAAESSHVDVIIVINKCDIGTAEEIEDWKEIYTACGYDVFVTSVKENIGLYQLSEALKNSTNLFCGMSGVGKSSLLNSLFPQLEFKVGEVSELLHKGKHTTVSAVLQKVDENTIIIDSPGIREFAPYGITNEDLSHYFIEFKPYMNNCKFNTCTHQHEPGCAVIEAVDNELISVERYYSYLNILENIEDIPKY